MHTYQDQSSGAWVAAFYQPPPKIDYVDQVREWCYNTYGIPARPNNLDSRWEDDLWWGEIRFKHEEDLVLFVMRWS